MFPSALKSEGLNREGLNCEGLDCEGLDCEGLNHEGLNCEIHSKCHNELVFTLRFQRLGFRVQGEYGAAGLNCIKGTSICFFLLQIPAIPFQLLQIRHPTADLTHPAAAALHLGPTCPMGMSPMLSPLHYIPCGHVWLLLLISIPADNAQLRHSQMLCRNGHLDRQACMC